jgi:hypothetical protein
MKSKEKFEKQTHSVIEQHRRLTAIPPSNRSAAHRSLFEYQSRAAFEGPSSSELPITRLLRAAGRPAASGTSGSSRREIIALPPNKPAAASRIAAPPFMYPNFSLERPLIEQQVGPAIAAEIAGHNLIPGVTPAVLHLQLRQISVAETAIELTPAGGAIVEK